MGHAQLKSNNEIMEQIDAMEGYPPERWASDAMEACTQVLRYADHFHDKLTPETIDQIGCVVVLMNELRKTQ